VVEKKKPNPDEKKDGDGDTRERGGGKRIVQLTSNQGDHQVGETFTTADAKKLGIEKHCTPFKS